MRQQVVHRLDELGAHRMREPSGTLDTSHAAYRALDARRVRVEGSRFEPAAQHTVKLEGSALAGFETLLPAGIRDPQVLADLDTWTATLREVLAGRVESLLALGPDDHQIQLRCYGADAILGDREPDRTVPREVGVLLQARAPDQATATAIAKIANPYLLHLPLPA